MLVKCSGAGGGLAPGSQLMVGLLVARPWVILIQKIALVAMCVVYIKYTTGFQVSGGKVFEWRVKSLFRYIDRYFLGVIYCIVRAWLRNGLYIY